MSKFIVGLVIGGMIGFYYGYDRGKDYHNKYEIKPSYHIEEKARPKYDRMKRIQVRSNFGEIPLLHSPEPYTKVYEPGLFRLACQHYSVMSGNAGTDKDISP